MKECNTLNFDTGMAEPKVNNLWPNPFVFFITIIKVREIYTK